MISDLICLLSYFLIIFSGFLMAFVPHLIEHLLNSRKQRQSLHDFIASTPKIPSNIPEDTLLEIFRFFARNELDEFRHVSKNWAETITKNAQFLKTDAYYKKATIDDLDSEYYNTIVRPRFFGISRIRIWLFLGSDVV